MNYMGRKRKPAEPTAAKEPSSRKQRFTLEDIERVETMVREVSGEIQGLKETLKDFTGSLLVDSGSRFRDSLVYLSRWVKNCQIAYLEDRASKIGSDAD